MSACKQTRKCVRCRRSYFINPSVGDFGIVCPFCGKVQLSNPKSSQIPKKPR